MPTSRKITRLVTLSAEELTEILHLEPGEVVVSATRGVDTPPGSVTPSGQTLIVKTERLASA